MATKLNGNAKFQTTLRVIFWLTPIIVGIVLSIGAYRERLDAMKVRVESIENKSLSNELAIAGITKDIIYIKEGILRIESKLDNNNE
jgi:hypothetical protein